MRHYIFHDEPAATTKIKMKVSSSNPLTGAAITLLPNQLPVEEHPEIKIQVDGNRGMNVVEVDPYEWRLGLARTKILGRTNSLPTIRSATNVPKNNLPVIRAATHVPGNNIPVIRSATNVSRNYIPVIRPATNVHKSNIAIIRPASNIERSELMTMKSLNALNFLASRIRGIYRK